MNTPKPNDGGPAFPYCKEMETIQGLQFSTGMSLRAYFAGQAMNGWLSSYSDDSIHHPAADDCEQSLAALSVKMADALIAELNK